MVNIPATLEHYNIDSLIPYERNSRIHSDEQIARIAASIEEFGFTNPILIDGEDGIIAGHGRLAAAKKLGMQTVPVIQLAHLSDAQKQAYIIADNRLAELSEWNKQLLAEELAELQSFDFDLSLIGFDDASLAEIMPAEKELQPLTDEDDVPEVDEKAPPKTKIGDVWILGSHRVMCGDSTDEAMVGKLMNGVKADMVFTDPPYDLPESVHYNETIEHNTHDSHVFVMHDDRGIVDYLRKSKLDFKRFFVANFQFSSPRGNDPYLQHILISHENSGQPIKHQNMHDGFSSIVKMEYRHRLKDEKTEHKHQKPVKFIEKFLQHYTLTSATIFDLFLGSGSTLIACENTERKCYGMELSPQYVELIIRRWQDYTGKQAHLEATGETFNSIASR